VRINKFDGLMLLWTPNTKYHRNDSSSFEDEDRWTGQTGRHITSSLYVHGTSTLRKERGERHYMKSRTFS